MSATSPAQPIPSAVEVSVIPGRVAADPDGAQDIARLVVVRRRLILSLSPRGSDDHRRCAGCLMLSELSAFFVARSTLSDLCVSPAAGLAAPTIERCRPE